MLEELKAKYQEALAVIAAEEFSPAGFRAFFEYMHVIPLHVEGDKWVDELYEAIANKLGILLEVHREGAKTTVTKFFVAFAIGHRPELCNSICRINDTKANETTQAIANIIEHDPRWKEVFPHVVPDKQKGWGANGYEVMRTDMAYAEWSEIKTQLPPDPTLVGRGWESGSWPGSRCNGVFMGDDIHDEKNTQSDRQLASVKKFYTDTLNQVFMEGCIEVWDFTPWLDNDLYAYLKTTGAYKTVKTPLLVPVNKDDPRAEQWPEDPLIPLSGKYYYRYWPEAWPWERISKKYRQSGATGFARMYLLDLAATKGLNLKKEWLHYYPAKDINPSWPVFMGVDYASTPDKLRHKDRDYFALALARAIPGGGIVVFDGLRQHLSKGEALETMAAYANMYPNYIMIGVESIGKGEEFYNDLVFMNDVHGRVLKLMSIPHHEKSKGKRFIEWLAPRCQMARIWFSDVENEFLRHFHDEWLGWQSGAKHDDVLDAVYMCALAAEGFLPSRAERTRGIYKKQKKQNPFHIGSNR